MKTDKICWKSQMAVFDKKRAAALLGVPASEIDRYTREGHLHPIFASKGGAPNFAEWELDELKRLKDGGTSSGVPVRRQSYSSAIQDLFCCPWCHGQLTLDPSGVSCATCQRTIRTLPTVYSIYACGGRESIAWSS